MPKEIIIFDMDGTLLDSSVDITRSINYVRAEIGLEPLSIDHVVQAINSDQRNLAQSFYQTQIYQPEHRKLFEAHYYNACIENINLFEEVDMLIETLYQKGISMSVATNAPSVFAYRMLKHLNIFNFFDHILGADQHKSKPNPEMINKILSNYGYDRSDNLQPVIVGDSLKDLHAGENAGIRAIHAAWGFDHKMRENSIKRPLDLLSALDIN